MQPLTVKNISNPLVVNEHIAVHVAEFFRSFSDTSRVRILSAIIEQESNPSTIAEMLGLTASAVSHHLRNLRQLRIVQARREGREVYYSIMDSHIIAVFQQGVSHIKEV